MSDRRSAAAVTRRRRLQSAAWGTGAAHYAYRLVIETMIRTWAAGVGRRHGIAFAEEFRRQRFGGIERWARELGAELPDDV